MIIRRYASSCASLIRFNCREFTVAYLRWLSFRIASTALTSPGDAPVPLKRRIGAGSGDADGAQAVREMDARQQRSAVKERLLRFFFTLVQALGKTPTARRKYSPFWSPPRRRQ